MSNKEYQLFNVLFVAFLICIYLGGLFLDDAKGLPSCQVLEATGQECKSCGLTRDFIAFAHLEFQSPINQQSIFVFMWIVIQLVLRIAISAKPSLIDPKLMKYDLIISLSTAIFIFAPFWM